MKGQATKRGGARKTKSYGCQNVYALHNPSPTTKSRRVHHQEGSLEAPKKGEKGGDNTPSKHCEPHE